MTKAHGRKAVMSSTFSEHRFCVAPMMEWTDRHCRAFHRILAPHARLYTEMVTAQAVIKGNRDRLLGYDMCEHPVALQLGGSEPEMLAEAARIGSDFGYDEINLNVGCPSDRVQTGRFGACLMREPTLVAECIAAMRAAVPPALPVTVKCRIGVDDQNPAEVLPDFVETVSAAGARVFIVHARKAWLKGLSPKENRDIPPLDYELVYALKRAWPDVTIVLNGGLDSAAACQSVLTHTDGAMMGRTAYQEPWVLTEIEQALFGSAPKFTSPHEAIVAYEPYLAAQLESGVPLHAMTRHMLGLMNGRAGARSYRRMLSEQALRPGAGLEILRAAAGRVRLDAGFRQDVAPKQDAAA